MSMRFEKDISSNYKKNILSKQCFHVVFGVGFCFCFFLDTVSFTGYEMVTG